jgi:hypothetical protein
MKGKYMRKLKVLVLTVGCLITLFLTTGNVAAQPGGAGGGRGGGRRGGGGGNFDPAAIREAQMNNYRTTFGVTDDAEWSVLEAAIGKVIDARTEVLSNVIRPARGGRGGRNGANNGGATPAAAGGRRGFGGFGAPPSSEATALQEALENQAPTDEIKVKLAALRSATAAAEAKLTTAQEELKKLLTSRQEGIAVLNGLLK